MHFILHWEVHTSTLFFFMQQITFKKKKKENILPAELVTHLGYCGWWCASWNIHMLLHNCKKLYDLKSHWWGFLSSYGPTFTKAFWMGRCSRWWLKSVIKICAGDITVKCLRTWKRYLRTQVLDQRLHEGKTSVTTIHSNLVKCLLRTLLLTPK